MKLTTNADPDKYGYRGNGIELDPLSEFPLPSGEWGKNVVIFAADNNLSVHADNNKDIRFLVKDHEMDYMMLQ